MIEITAQPSQRYTPPVDDWESFIQICHEEDFSGLPMLGYRQDYEIATVTDLSIHTGILTPFNLDDLTRSE
jgi:hypothetical protein